MSLTSENTGILSGHIINITFSSYYFVDVLGLFWPEIGKERKTGDFGMCIY